MHCRWCGSDLPRRARVCPECDHPTNVLGYSTVILGALILPATAVGIAEYLEDEQRAAERELFDRQQLTEAYQELGAAISAFRSAAVHIEGACLSTTRWRCHDELRAGVYALDAAVDAIGPRLAPFNEYSLRKSGEDALTDSWLRCFVAPYYGTATGDGGRWADLQAVFAGELCGDGACDPLAAVELSRVVGEVYAGPCVDGLPEASRPLTWFHREAQRIVFGRDPADLLPPGGEVPPVGGIAAPPGDPQGAAATADGDTPETRTVTAWAAFDAEQYERAASVAERCVTRYLGLAEAQQQRLGDERPPVGAVEAGQQLQIFRRGELNDVATCLWIRGSALRELGRSEEAERVFDAALRLPGGRTWDPRGWFWSPAQAVEELRGSGD